LISFAWPVVPLVVTATLFVKTKNHDTRDDK
jgi:hypothetical protein